MALKRKRSSAAFSTTAVSHIDMNMNSVPFFYPTQKALEPLHQKPTWSFPTYEEYATHSNLNSRTRKRHRDDRPDEQAVHANTIQKLYEAQRQHPRAEPVPSQPVPLERMEVEVQPQKTTLHRFWNITQPPAASTGMDFVMPSGADGASGIGSVEDWDSRCEDCDRGLRSEDGMDLDDESRIACHRCGRRVCDGCAVTWSERTCLPCACR